jgi:membrane protein DedA with SNARE-associated domain
MNIVLLVLMASAGILSSISDTIVEWVAKYGYPAVFGAAFLEVIFPPIPSEVVYPLVGFTVQSKGLGFENAIGMATAGALGSTVAAMVIYFVSQKVGRIAIVKFGKRVRVSEQDIERSERWFEKYGPVAVFVARLIPGIRSIISIPAGISRMNIAKFALYTFAGSLVWCTILTLVGYYLGNTWRRFSEQAESAFDIVSIVVITSVIIGIGLWYIRRNKRASAMQ